MAIWGCRPFLIRPSTSLAEVMLYLNLNYFLVDRRELGANAGEMGGTHTVFEGRGFYIISKWRKYPSL